jgi:hypothetical protein
MALFGSEDKQEKKRLKEEQQVADLLNKYGLSNLKDPEDIQSVRKIVSELAGTGLMEFGLMLGGNEKEYLKLVAQYNRALLEQNFIIIRQLDKIANK